MAVIAVLALILIGPKQLPEVARTVGRFLNELKRSTDTLKDEFNSELHRVEDQITSKRMADAAPKISDSVDPSIAPALPQEKKNDPV